MINLSLYQTASSDDWKGRIDSDRVERFHQAVTILDLTQTDFFQKITRGSFCLLGFCSDAGVIRNHGRPGAAEGPDALRKMMANFPLHHPLTIYDAGNVLCVDQDLEAAQDELAKTIRVLTDAGLNVIVLGGGHEVAWGHYQGIAQATQEQHLGIINFDAHYDLRPLLKNNQGSSGTPFLQIANSRGPDRFHYCCIGVQETANTPSLFEQAKLLNVKTILADEVHRDLCEAQKQLLAYADQFDALYITLCMDVFSQAVAPGVSAPQANGLLPKQIIPMIETLAKQHKPLYFDIAELAPCYDQDSQTARLAASCLYQFISTALEIQ
jgi:formiminoglutamase